MADLLGRAEAADQADIPDGMQVPEELARREKRLAEIVRAKAVIEARATERHARERAEYEARVAEREAKAAQTGKKPGVRWTPKTGQMGWTAPTASVCHSTGRENL